MEKRTKIVELIASISGKAELPPDEESLLDAGVLDSFGVTDLVSALEQAFGFQVPDADLRPRKFDSVAKIEAYLADRGV